MKRSDYFILFGISLIYFGCLALIQKVPGYMDAEYYFQQGLQFVQHHNLDEFFLWNFLSPVETLPAAGFAYWMPMTSFVAVAGMWLTKGQSFFNAKVLLIFMDACLPVLSAWLATRFIPKRAAGWLAAGLALFSGYYLSYLTTTDTFVPYLFLGGIFFVISNRLNQAGHKSVFMWNLALGICSGMMALTRSDGLMWIAAAWMVAWLSTRQKPFLLKQLFISLTTITVGFMIVMVPWYGRNYLLYQSILPPGTRSMVWLTQYADIFLFPAERLSYARWISGGIGPIVIDRLSALWTNLQTLLAGGMSIILLPFILLGAWKQRKNLLVRITGIMLAVILIVMSVIFPYAGERGGFFHSISALQIVLWSLTPAGLWVCIEWGIRKRGWKDQRSWRLFSAALVMCCAGISAFQFSDAIRNGVDGNGEWNQTLIPFQDANNQIISITGNSERTVMVNDPPGFTLATGRNSVMIPSGGIEAVIGVCEKFDVGYLWIDGERAELLSQLESHNRADDSLELLFSGAGGTLYECN